VSKDQQSDPVYAREHAEPVERNNPVPWLLGLIASSLCVWGVSYFLLNPTLAPATVSPAQPAATAPQAVATPPAAAPVAADGGQIFSSRCASCHQPTGAGLPGVFPPLAGSEWVNGDAGKVADILLLGVSGPITVNGATFDSMMPAFGHQLSDAEIAAVASYVRASFGNKSPAVTPDAVKAARAKLGNRSTPWTGEAELQAQH
jgi:mono/diheme cytochrome c family protein